LSEQRETLVGPIIVFRVNTSKFEVTGNINLLPFTRIYRETEGFFKIEVLSMVVKTKTRLPDILKSLAVAIAGMTQCIVLT
jgi:hypothetical protein